MKIRKNKSFVLTLISIATHGDIEGIVKRHFKGNWWEFSQYLQTFIKDGLAVWDGKNVTLTEKGKKIYEKIK